MNEGAYKKESEMTEEEKEQLKPFWTRTYMTGKQEFKFKPEFID